MSTDNVKEEYQLLIIGGGPAGLTAAAYAIRKRLDALLISEDLGGKTNYAFSLPDIDTHLIIDGQELVGKFKSQIEYLDFARHLARVTKFKRTSDMFQASTKDRTFKAKSAIIATGVAPRRLNVPGEKEFLGRGVSYSSTSHVPIFVDVEVAVVGNGVRALQAAAELANIASKVSVISLSPELVRSSLGRKISQRGKTVFFSDHRVKEIRGTESPEAIVITKKNSEIEIPAKGIFVEMGYVPNSQLFSRLVKTTKDGRIKIDRNNQTSFRGLFAAGDVTDVQAQQVIIAIGEGAKAALNAYDYLLGLKQ